MRIRRLVPVLLFAAMDATLTTTAIAQTNTMFFVPRAEPYLGLIAADDGYVVENPRMIAGPIVDRAIFSPNGRFLIAARHDVDASVRSLAVELEQRNAQLPVPVSKSGVVSSLVLYNAATRHSNVVWTGRTDANTTLQLRLVGWMGGSSVAIASLITDIRQPDGTTTSTTSVLFINADHGTAQETVLSPNLSRGPKEPKSFFPGYVGLAPSPRAPFATIVNPEVAADGAVQFLKGDGTLTDPIKLPGFVWFSRWSDDGTEMRGNTIGSEGGQSTKHWYAVNPATGAVRDIPEPPTSKGGGDDPEPAPQPLPFHWAPRPKPGSATMGLSLESADGTEHVAIAAEGAPLAVVPEAAVYSIAGGLYVAPIQKIGRAAFDHLIEARLIADLQQRGSRLSSVLFVYALKHGGLYPPADANLSKLLGDNLTTADLDGFIYQPPANRQLKRRAVAAEVVGTLTGPGGKMTIYNDGQAVRQTDTKP